RFFNKEKEPIPSFPHGDPESIALLEQALASPQQSWGGQDLYLGLEDKASVLMYNLIKLHPFENGNKRIALVTTLYFLAQNKYWLRFNNDEEIVDFTENIAASDAKHYERIRQEIAGFILDRLEPF
ncbi:MAG: type II toxin-antitoxin system death-on-curing family toxin, partial [Candidatus Aquicultor sp.]